MSTHQMEGLDFWGRVPDHFAAILDHGEDALMHLTYFFLGDEQDSSTPVGAVVRMEPGAVVVRHSHPAQRMEVVIKGSMKVGDVELLPGDVMRAEPGELYGPHIAGPEGVTTVEFFSSADGARFITYDTPRGLISRDLTERTPRPADVITA